MKNVRCLRLAFVLVVLLLPLPVRGNSTRGDWEGFLANPNADRYHALAEKLRGCKDSECRNEVRPSSRAVARLLLLVKRGDPNAVDLAFLSIRFLDGGNLEDTLRTLGSLTETSPNLFLQEVKKHGLPSYQVRRLLRMLPLDTVDNVAKKRRLVRRRVASLAAVDDKNLVDVRDAAIAVLEEFLAQLQHY